MNSRWYMITLVALLAVLVGCSTSSDTTESAPKFDRLVDPGDGSGESPMPLNVNAEVPAWPGNTGSSVQNVEPMIIKVGSLSLKVEETDAALAQITSIAAEYGGYVIRSSSSHYSTYDSASVTIAVRAEQFEQAMIALQEIGLEVESVSTSGEDVTAEYVDLESRLRNLEATRDRLLTFLNDAQNAEEAILVNDRLAAIEGDIEQVKGRMNFLTGRAMFSTITLDLREPDAPATQDDDGWSPGRVIKDAINAQGDLVRIVVNAVIWLVIVAGPYAVIVGGVVMGWRRFGPKRTMKSQVGTPETNKEMDD